MHRETAEDICSQVFFQAFRFVSKNHPDIDNFRSWIYKIATNEINAHYRSMKRKRFVSYEDEKTELSRLLPDRKNISMDKYTDFLAVRDVLAELKDDDRLLIELFYFEKLKYSEISKIMKIKVTSLRSRVCRILKKMEMFLEKE
jgi:RNA polymerase sigma-70 factor, ECF subfamily